MSWDYTNVNSHTWNVMSLEWQLEHLIKYYPIGMELEFIFDRFMISNFDMEELKDLYIVKNHLISPSMKIYNLQLYCKKSGTIKDYIHPGFFRPTLKYLRENKLNRILK